ncbi:MAG: hypothetical protein WBV94_29385 [Blastocatellia bacterium]
MINTFRVRTSQIIASLIIIYLATLTWDYYWDGITFALQIEKVANDGRAQSLLFHQNHLLYNALGYVFYKSAHALGLGLRALNILQLANACAGALAVGVFFRIAQRALRSPYAAVICSAALASSAAWWKISTDVNAYILTLLLILVCADNLLGAKPRWFIAGLALSGAMLFHELAAVFYPAALTAVFSNRIIERKMRFAVGMSALSGALVISVYYLCAATMHGITHPFELIKWAASNPSEMAFSHGRTGGMLTFLRSNIDAIVGHNFGLFRRQSQLLELTIALAALTSGIIFVIIIARKVNIMRAIRTLPQARNQIVPVLVAWIGAYMLFLLFWGPLIYFRAFYAPALALAVGLALSNYHNATGTRPTGAAVFAVAAFALFNLAFYIGPNMRADSNAMVAAARNANKVWNERTVIYFADRKEVDTAFEYFNQSSAWRRLPPEGLTDQESESDEGGSIWLNKGAAESVGQKWLATHASGQVIEVELSNGTARYVELSPRR